MERFTPWQGQDFSGKMDYVIDGKKFSAFRDFNKNNCKIFDDAGTEITSEFTKDKARGAELGFTHFGIDEDTFLNSIFVSQGNSEVGINERNSVIQKLTNIIQSGEESISYDKAKEKLHKRLLDEVGTDRTRNKPINNLIREIEAFEKTRDELIYNRDKKEKLKEKENELAKEIKETQLYIEDIEKVFEIKEKYARITSEREKEYEISLKVLEKEKTEREKRSKKLKNRLFMIVLFASLAIAGVLTFYQLYLWTMIPLILIFIGFLIIHHSFSENVELLPPQNIESIKDMLKRKEKKELEALYKDGISDEITGKRIIELKNMLSELEKEKENLILEQHKLKLEEENLSRHLEKLNDVEEQLYDLYEKEEELRKLEFAIKLADTTLDSAYEELKQDIVPRIEKTIKSNISLTTNGKYENAIYNDRQGILFENDVGDMISCQKLSMGTIDQIYLGFRLAMSEEMGNVPIFLDETFAYYDDQRLENLLRVLSLRDDIPQIFIMTCTDREKRILDGFNIGYNKIEI